MRVYWLIAGFIMLSASALGSFDFALNDQFGQAHSRADVFSGERVVIIAGSQRKTPDAMERWDKSLRQRVPEAELIFGLSNLKKLPFFVPKKSVRRTLAKKLPNTPVLLDWKGNVYPALELPEGATIAVAVFDGSGRPLGIVVGDANDARVDEVRALLSR